MTTPSERARQSQPHGSKTYAARGLRTQCTEYVSAAMEILTELGILPATAQETP